MNRMLSIALALLCTPGLILAEPSDDESLAVATRVQARVAAGDTTALNDLAVVPGKYSWPVLVAAFRKNRKDVSLLSKCAQLAVTVPQGQEQLLRLLSREAVNNDEFSQQEIAIKFLVLNHDKISVRILGGSLAGLNPKEMGPFVTEALTALNPPGSPVTPKDHVPNDEALARWRHWWDANKAGYLGEAAAKPAP